MTNQISDRLLSSTFQECPLLFILFSALLSFTVCSTLKKKSVLVACELTAMWHHIIAVIIGIYAVYINKDFLWTEAALGANDSFPIVIGLQHFNIGYFLYDFIHVVM